MKVLFVLSVSPYPKNVGKRIMLGGICDFLRESNEVDAVCIASFAADEPGPALDYTALLPRPSSRRRIFNALWYSVLLQRKSLQESFFWNPAAEQKLQRLIRLFQPDLILYDTVRTGQYSQGRAQSECVEVIYMDDLFSVRYEKMLRVMRQQGLEGIDAMGNFGNNVPRALLRICQKYPVLQKLLLKVERRWIAASEDRAPGQFDRALLISSVEQGILRQRTGADNVFSIPPRVEGLPFHARSWNGRPEFVFVGALNLAHNANSIETFLESNMERLIWQIPGVSILIVGKGASENLKRLAALYAEHIVLSGFVKNLDEVLLRACAMISPLTFGSGVKLKVIEALRCGIPLVTTTHGAEGVEVADSRGVLEVELDGFPDAMECLLDAGINATASRDNAELYRRFYAPDAVDAVYSRMLLGVEARVPARARLDSAAS